MKLLTALLALSLLVGCSDPTGGGESEDPTGGGEKIVGEYDNGLKEYDGYVLEDGSRVGLWTFWYENGQKWFVGSFKNGEWDGLWTLWNEDGSIYSDLSGIYEAGEKVAPLPDDPDK